jgi:membrane protein required for colicin V production
MSSLDAGVIAISLILLIRGIWVGLVRQLASIAALLLGFVIAGKYYQQFSQILSPFINRPQLSFLITYGLIFLLVFVSVITLGLLLKKVMTVSLLGWFDRLTGGLFGLTKGVIVTTIFFMALAGMLSSSNPLLADSFFAPYLLRSSAYFLKFIKDQELHQHFHPKEPAISPLLSLSIPPSKTKRGNPQ